jgi:4-amino-4-deoxy-L-arabinose transferase-like glycosyltransferase
VRQGLSRPFWLALVIAAFCLPLFFGLGRTDVENDEGIYSYAVDQILINGDWLNPRASPDEAAIFLEKPPLKFWIVALPIRLGLLPHNEVGLRFWDALFGAVSFLYVFAIGRRLGGMLCGLISVIVLFVYEPLLFDHGLRGNNMEAPLFLCYCGGIYHYLAWGTLEDTKRRRRHIIGVAGYFFLGFMTKFVAALFLPVVLAATSLMLPDTRRRLFADFKFWVAAGAGVLALTAPWFIYQQLTSGSAVWSVMFGAHVFQRFTASLDASHLHPWNYYWVTLWKDFTHMGTSWLALGGVILLCVDAWRLKRLEHLTVLAWLFIPLGLMSAGTSKLYHYCYPFVPPVALAVGFGPAWLARTGAEHIDRAMTAIHDRMTAARTWSRFVRNALLVATFIAAGLAVATLLLGSVHWRIGGVTIVRNSHVARPLLVALVLATLSGRGVMAARIIFPTALLMLVLPINGYEDVLRRIKVEAHPLRSARDCLTGVRGAQLAAGGAAPGIYAIGERKWFLHSYYYYLHHVGGWDRTDDVNNEFLNDALFVPGRQRPVLIGDAEYGRYKTGREQAMQEIPLLRLREVLLLMPGPYGVCEPKATKPRVATRRS